MDKINQLTTLCIFWRKIIEVKQAQYKALDRPHPSQEACYKMVQLSVQLRNLRLELADMENELCEHLYIPPYLYA